MKAVLNKLATVEKSIDVFDGKHLFKWYELPLSLRIDDVKVEGLFKVTIDDNGEYTINADNATVNDSRVDIHLSNINGKHSCRVRLYEDLQIAENRNFNTDISKKFDMFDVTGHIEGFVYNNNFSVSFKGAVNGYEMTAFSYSTVDGTGAILNVEAKENRGETITLLKLLAESLAPYEV